MNIDVCLILIQLIYRFVGMCILLISVVFTALFHNSFSLGSLFLDAIQR